jgi:hypothetical protein
MTARQPGEGRQGAKVSPETGTMWRTTAQPTAAFLDLSSAPHAHGRTALNKRLLRSDSATERAENRIVGTIFVEREIGDARIQLDKMPLVIRHDEVRM